MPAAENATTKSIKLFYRRISLFIGACTAIVTAVRTIRKVPETAHTVGPYLRLFM